MNREAINGPWTQRAGVVDAKHRQETWSETIDDDLDFARLLAGDEARALLFGGLFQSPVSIELKEVSCFTMPLYFSSLR